MHCFEEELFILKVSSTRMPLFEEEMNRLFTNCELPIFFVHLRGMSRQECIQGFSDGIFWDVDRDHIDLSLHAPYVVQRVLEYGQISDWKLLLAYYGLDEIVSISKNLRSLDPRALSFISTISRTPQEQFRCYNTRQSNPEHCNF